MKLITDGEKWAIRKWSWFWWGYEYFDLATPGLWWTKHQGYFGDCWADEKKARQWFRRMTQ
jgi:hypothetical protein